MITCTNCKTVSEKSDFVDHLLETNLKCLNASYRQRLWTNKVVALDISAQKDGAKCDVFVCLVCKTCEELGLYKDFVEERTKFVQLHSSRCGSRFSEIELKIKPSAIELFEAQKIVQQKRHPSCLKCGYDAGGNEYNLKRHIATCKGINENILDPCTKCGYDADGNYSNLKRHKASCKGPKVVVKKCCEKCGYDGKGNTSNLRRHILTCKGPKGPKEQKAPPRNTVVFAEPERGPEPQSEIPDWIHKRLCEAKDHYGIEDDDEDYTDEDIFNMLFQDVKKADENTKCALEKQQSRCDAFTKEVSDLKDNLFELCCLIQSIRREDRGIILRLAAPTTMGIVKRILDDDDDDGFSDCKDERTQLQKMDDQLYDRDHTISILRNQIKQLQKSAKEKDTIIETYGTLKIMKPDTNSDSDWD